MIKNNDIVWLECNTQRIIYAALRRVGNVVQCLYRSSKRAIFALVEFNWPKYLDKCTFLYIITQ